MDNSFSEVVLYENDRRQHDAPTSVELEEADSEVKFKWRSVAKIIAYIFLVLELCAFVGILAFAIHLIYLFVKVKMKLEDPEMQEMFPQITPRYINANILLVTLVLILFTYLLVVAFKATLRLRTAATMIGGEPEKLLEECSYWRNASIYYLILQIIPLLRKGYDKWYTYLWLIFYVACICLVHMHVRELDKIVKAKERYAAEAAAEEEAERKRNRWRRE